MVRTRTFVVGMVLSLLAPLNASADAITPVDLDTWTGNTVFLRSHTDRFRVAHPPFVVGGLSRSVFFDGVGAYTYVLRTTPAIPGSLPGEPAVSTHIRGRTDPFGRTEFGFTGVAGWSFSDARAARGDGDERDFRIGLDVFTGQLSWSPFPPTWLEANAEIVYAMRCASSGFGSMAANALAEAGHTVYASTRETAGRNAPQVAAVGEWSNTQGADLRVVGASNASRSAGWTGLTR